MKYHHLLSRWDREEPFLRVTYNLLYDNMVNFLFLPGFMLYASLEKKPSFYCDTNAFFVLLLMRVPQAVTEPYTKFLPGSDVGRIWRFSQYKFRCVWVDIQLLIPEGLVFIFRNEFFRVKNTIVSACCYDNIERCFAKGGVFARTTPSAVVLWRTDVTNHLSTDVCQLDWR